MGTLGVLRLSGVRDSGLRIRQHTSAYLTYAHVCSRMLRRARKWPPRGHMCVAET